MPKSTKARKYKVPKSATYQWKFLNRSGRNGPIVSDWTSNCVWKVGEKKSVDAAGRSIVVCWHGLHSSPTIAYAQEYVNGRVLALVACWGERDHEHRTDYSVTGGELRLHKSAWQHQVIVKAWETPNARLRKAAVKLESSCKSQTSLVAALNKALKPVCAQ